ncbi:transient receptor potential cation channel subfamily A member 1-like isoform X2 [Clavelina lepadiformis]|uniref:Ion transport domain-containing protein n=1 Tax=Clavelina lepadiformis TaxID=159417 RepID=A0ABP0H4X7_CLALP
MEMKDRKTSLLQGPKALGAALVANINPAFAQTSPISEQNPVTMPDHVRVYTQSDLANLTFHQVAREGDVMLMEKLLERLPHVQQRKKRLNARDDGKLTPMHYAARYHHYHMINFLISNGANVQPKGEDDATPLHFIAKYKKKKAVEAQSGNDDDDSSSDEELPPEESFSCLKLLVEHGAHVNPKDAMGLTPLHQACTRGNTTAVRELLECPGLALEMTDHQGMTALHLACLYRRKTIVKLLLEAGSSLKCKDKDMTTPLHLACAEGSIQIAQFLLDKADTLAESAQATYVNGDGDGKSNSKGSNNDSKTNEGKPLNGFSKLVRSTTSNSLGIKLAAWKGGAAGLLNDVDAEKNLPFHLAIENGHMNLVEFCVEKSRLAGLGSMVDVCRSRDDSCLHLAVQANSIEIVKFLMKEGADINARNSSLVTPLLLACQHNAHIIVKHLLQSGANIEMKDSDFMTPLLIASRYGHLETITYLLEYNADITETDKDDRTCLMWAAEENRSDALTILLRRNKMRLMIEERDKYNNTALHLASVKGHTDTVKLLLNHRASADIKNDDDRTTLHMASLHGHDAIIPDLVNRDRSIINSGDEEANSALHLAAIGGNLNCVSVLIQSGANIELRNARQWTPLDCAAAYGWAKAARCLLEAGASIQPRGKIKVCALHLACQRGHVEMVHLLLQWKADVTFRSADGRNALDYAIDCSQKECVLALIRHETWQQSLKNAVINPVSGRMTTPMRRLISKMEDMAQIVCNQCITDNGKKPENDDYSITLNYEFFDDMFASTEWMERIEAGRPDSSKTTDTTPLAIDDTQYSVYDDAGQLTPEALTYSKDSDELQKNHPLKIMVDSKCEGLLVHPVVTGLLNYKWRRYGRYLYYFNLLLFVTYLVLLNVYMMLLPAFYRIDWVKTTEYRKYFLNLTGANESYADEFAASGNRTDCWFFRGEYDIPSCQFVNAPTRGLRWGIFGFAVFNLARELFQFVNQKLGYFDITNVIEVTLYILSLILTFNFTAYSLPSISVLTDQALTVDDVSEPLMSFQGDTGLRQEWQQEVGAFAVFLSWMGLLLFIQKIPRLGIFVVMFTDILKTFGQFFLVFVFFIFGFAFAFTILLGNQAVFENWYEALVSTSVMMIGELDYTSKFFGSSAYEEAIYTREVTYVLFVIFLLVMTIIIMNLLVGLAVGDIIQVQEHATLERLGMQVALTLEVEFTLPAFLRKKLCLRKQKMEINKYRKANFIKKLLFEDSEMSIEHISKALDKEAVDQDEVRSDSDKILLSLSTLRNKMGDLMADQAEVKQGVRSVRSMVRDVKSDAKIYAEDIKDNVSSSGVTISRQIDMTHTGLTQTTQLESNETRGKVDGTRAVVAELQTDVERTKQEIALVKTDLERRMDVMQKALLSRSWEELESGMKRCQDMVEKSKSELMESLEEMKIVFMREKFMSNV